MSNIYCGAKVKYDDLYPGMIVRIEHGDVTRVDTVVACVHDSEDSTFDLFLNGGTACIQNIPDSFEFEVIHCPEYVDRYHKDKPSE